jgi:hypothetical protein
MQAWEIPAEEKNPWLTPHAVTASKSSRDLIPPWVWSVCRVLPYVPPRILELSDRSQRNNSGRLGGGLTQGIHRDSKFPQSGHKKVWQGEAHQRRSRRGRTLARAHPDVVDRMGRGYSRRAAKAARASRLGGGHSSIRFGVLARCRPAQSQDQRGDAPQQPSASSFVMSPTLLNDRRLARRSGPAALSSLQSRSLALPFRHPASFRRSDDP